VPNRSLLLAKLALLLAACGSPDQTIDLVFDPCEPLSIGTDSSELGDQRSIEEATRLWNELAGTRLSLAEGETPVVMVGFEEAAPAHKGLYDDERGVIIVNRNLEEGRPLTITIAHEIGHAMGLLHVKDSGRRSVMVPGNTDTPPGEVDREALTALWGECPPR
jgi:hypothetical protein